MEYKEPKDTVRNKKFLLNRLKAMYGEDFHPIMKMAKNANRLQELVEDGEGGENEIADLKASIEAWDKVAPYVAPKLKAIELSTDDEGLRFIQRVENVIVDPKS
jgi:hypothetical protein